MKLLIYVALLLIISSCSTKTKLFYDFSKVDTLEKYESSIEDVVDLLGQPNKDYTNTSMQLIYSNPRIPGSMDTINSDVSYSFIFYDGILINKDRIAVPTKDRFMWEMIKRFSNN